MVANPVRGLLDRKRSEEHLPSSNESKRKTQTNKNNKEKGTRITEYTCQKKIDEGHIVCRIDLSNANPACGHKEVRRSTGHIIHGDNPLLRPTEIQIATKNYVTLQAIAPSNIKRFIKPPCSISRASEHPPIRGGNSKTFRWDHRVQMFLIHTFSVLSLRLKKLR